MTNINRSDAKKLVESGRKWVSSLDRTPLGIFAVSDNVLAHSYVSLMREYSFGKPTDEIQTYVTMGLNEALYPDSWATLAELEELRMLASAEVYSWWIWTMPDFRDDEYNMTLAEYVAGKRGYEFGLLEAMTRLERVAANPVRHPYYAVDIWDDDFIDSCISDGVDPGLAVELAKKA